MKLKLTYSVKTWLVIQDNLPIDTFGDRIWFKIEVKIFCKDANKMLTISFTDKEMSFLDGLERKLGLRYDNPLT